MKAQDIDLYCIAGDTASAVLAIDSEQADNYSHSGSIVLNNPTVAYLDSIYINKQKINLQRIKPDSIVIPLQILTQSRPFKMQLFFKALAGNDSITDIRFVDFKLNGNDALQSVIHFHNIAIGGSIPYLKFAELRDCYPNPVTPYSGANFKYFIDRISNVTFTLVDPIGQERLLAKYSAQTVGEHLFHIDIDHTYSSGAYYLVMQTETGNAKTKFWVIR